MTPQLAMAVVLCWASGLVLHAGFPVSMRGWCDSVAHGGPGPKVSPWVCVGLWGEFWSWACFLSLERSQLKIAEAVHHLQNTSVWASYCEMKGTLVWLVISQEPALFTGQKAVPMSVGRGPCVSPSWRLACGGRHHGVVPTKGSLRSTWFLWLSL